MYLNSIYIKSVPKIPICRVVKTHQEKAGQLQRYIGKCSVNLHHITVHQHYFCDTCIVYKNYFSLCINIIWNIHVRVYLYTCLYESVIEWYFSTTINSLFWIRIVLYSYDIVYTCMLLNMQSSMNSAWFVFTVGEMKGKDIYGILTV